MGSLEHLIKSNPQLRAALIVPLVIAFIFSFFNLSAAIDPAHSAKAVTLGIVNLDTGVPSGMKISDQLIGGLSANLPFTVKRFGDEAAGRAALEAGEASAVLVIPANFTVAAVTPGPKSIKVVTSQHLSLVETQLAAALPAQLQAGIAQALTAVAAANGGPPPVQVTVQSEVLHAASSPVSLTAPFVMTFATWIASMVGALLLFIGTRTPAGGVSKDTILAARLAIPAVGSGLASLMLALIVATATGTWGAFFGLWFTVWIVIFGLTLLFEGLFAVLDFWALIVILPFVFYQPVLSGAQAPLGASPDWIQWVGDLLPLSQISTAYRSLLIGGPYGNVIWVALGAAVIGGALVWAGRYLYTNRRRSVAAAHA